MFQDERVGEKNRDRAYFLGIICVRDHIEVWCPRCSPSLRKKFETELENDPQTVHFELHSSWMGGWGSKFSKMNKPCIRVRGHLLGRKISSR